MHTLEQLQTGQLAGHSHLKLACGLTEFPRDIFALADTLEVLDLTDNALTELPADLPRLHRLRVLFCSNNAFTHLPEVLGQCPALSMVGFKANQIREVSAAALPAQLRWLILTDNQLQALPTEIGQCNQLQKLMLAGNQLQALPNTLARCTRLELLRLSANQLTALPDWLLTLPRLSWLAFGGNPLCAALENAARLHAPIADIAWPDLQIGPVLGQGASGVIHQAIHLRPGIAEPVAVKLFKGDVTSDGSPLSEMAASIQAGKHPHLIPALARVVDHPMGTQGLVMPLIPPSLSNLAGPPSLDSCTRDVYPPDTRLDLPGVLQLATGMASAAAHLHQRGVLHGDLYGHNILYSPQGHALLGDFGAASLYEPDNGPLAQVLEHLEVRAFGCLLEELITHCAQDADTRASLGQLTDLKNQCLRSETTERPSFNSLLERLVALTPEVHAF
jgi:hypothetical protein